MRQLVVYILNCAMCVWDYSMYSGISEEYFMVRWLHYTLLFAHSSLAHKSKHSIELMCGTLAAFKFYATVYLATC